MPGTYPMLVDLTGKLVVVVGGGAVAVRKVKGLLDSGATQICVIAPEIAPEMPERIKPLRREFAPDDLNNASLVFAATDSAEVNDLVTREAHRRGIWVNRADAEDDSDFATPAIWRKESLMVTVSTQGNPALSAKIRDVISIELDSKWEKLATAAARLRPVILRNVGEIESRRKIFRALATDEAANVAGDENELRRWLVSKFPGLDLQQPRPDDER